LPCLRSQSLDPAFRTAWLELLGRRTPRAFHGLDLRLGDGPTFVRRTPSSRDLLQPFGLRLPVAPLLRRKPSPIPSGAVGLLDRSPSRPRIASRRSSAVPTRCLESVSTTDVHVTSTRRKHPFRRLPVERRGKPADVRLRDRSSFVRLSPRRSSGAGPPRGHPTSDGHTLDGVPAGFGPVSYLFSHDLSRREPRGATGGTECPTFASFRAGGEAPGRCLPKAPLPTRPSDTSHRQPDRDPRCLKARLCSRRLTPLPPEHVNAADFRRVEVSSIVGDRRRSAFEPRRGVLVPAGQPGQVPHVFIVVRGPRLDPCSYALRVRLQGRVRSHDFCNRCFHEHDHGPLRTSRRPETVVGTTAIVVESRLSTGNRQSFSRTGAEVHRTSALPTGIAPGRDFAPTPIASGTSCREDRSSPCPERRGRGTEPPAQRTLARCASREGRATPHLREEARRSPTRGAFHRQAARIASGCAVTAR